MQHKLSGSELTVNHIVNHCLSTTGVLLKSTIFRTILRHKDILSLKDLLCQIVRQHFKPLQIEGKESRVMSDCQHLIPDIRVIGDEEHVLHVFCIGCCLLNRWLQSQTPPVHACRQYQTVPSGLHGGRWNTPTRKSNLNLQPLKPSPTRMMGSLRLVQGYPHFFDLWATFKMSRSKYSTYIKKCNPNIYLYTYIYKHIRVPTLMTCTEWSQPGLHSSCW